MLAAGLLYAHARLQPRGYSNAHHARVVHYTLRSALLARSLPEIGVIPAAGGGGRLLVLLHGRHDPSPLHLLGDISGPQSMLNDAFFAGLARLGPRAPVVVLLNGGGHSYFHDRRDGPWATSMLRETIPDAVRRFHTHGRIAIGVWTSGGSSAPGAFDDAEDYKRNDIFAAAPRLKGIPVWLDNGDRDPFLDADAKLARELHVTQHVWPGGHTGSYWHAHMAQYLRFYETACRMRRKTSAAT